MTSIFALTSLLSPALAISCYYPDGSLAANDKPCSPTASEQSPSNCCGFGFACLSNTICQLTPVTPCCGTDLYERGSCTDQTWGSSACPNFCIQGNPRGGYPLFKCSTLTDEYCCYNYNCTCNGEGVIEFAGQPVVGTTIGFSAPPISTAESTSSSLPTSISTTPVHSPSSETTSSSSGISPSDIIGIVFGVLGFLGVIAGGIAAWYARKQYKISHRDERQSTEEEQTAAPTVVSRPSARVRGDSRIELASLHLPNPAPAPSAS